MCSTLVAASSFNDRTSPSALSRGSSTEKGNGGRLLLPRVLMISAIEMAVFPLPISSQSMPPAGLSYNSRFGSSWSPYCSVLAEYYPEYPRKVPVVFGVCVHWNDAYTLCALQNPPESTKDWDTGSDGPPHVAAYEPKISTGIRCCYHLKNPLTSWNGNRGRRSPAGGVQVQVGDLRMFLYRYDSRNRFCCITQ